MDREKSPLLARGWVYQERLLSPRILHFGFDELSWECNEASYCACGFHWTQFLFTPKQRHHKMITTSNSHEKAAYWRTVVENYSELELSRTSDRLTALFGIAKQVRQSRHCRYLAGIWEDSVLEDLCWASIKPRTFKREKKSTPSWSWAAVDGGVIYPGNDELAISSAETKYCKITQLPDKEWTPIGQDMTITAKESSIHLSGWIVLATVLFSQLQAAQMQAKSVLYRVKTANQTADSFWPDGVLDEGTCATGVIYCLRLMTTNMDGIDYGLVLRSLDSSKQAFERIGLASWNLRKDSAFEDKWYLGGTWESIVLV
jgi:hypothetical protein